VKKSLPLESWEFVILATSLFQAVNLSPLKLFEMKYGGI
jgi:hypothetical protein